MLRRNKMQGLVIAVFAVAALSACGAEDAAKDAAGDAAGQVTGGQNAPAEPAPGSESASNSAGAPSEGAGDADKGSASGLQAKLDELLKASPIVFAAQSPDLNEEGKGTLKKVGEAAAGVPDAKLEVRATAGYPDAAQAKELSQKRADAVTQELVAGGVKQENIESVAVGNEGVLGDDKAATTVDISAKQ